MRVNKHVLSIVQASAIAGMYIILTYAQEIILPNSTSMAVQFRVSEVLTILALFTPAAIPGLTIGCVLANLVALSALPIDMIMGSSATFLAVLLMYNFRNIKLFNIPILSLLMPAIFNGVIIGLEIEIFFIPGKFNILSFITQASLVALGELVICFVLGIPLIKVLEKTKLSNRLFHTA